MEHVSHTTSSAQGKNLQSENTPRVVIVGGGAAGLVAAISAAELGASCILLESSERVGTSIRRSGNGRCNFSNSMIAAHTSLYHNAPFVAHAFSRVTPDEVLKFFASLGLIWREEDDGRLYPLSNKATSVLDAVRFAAIEAGVEICCNAHVSKIERHSKVDSQEKGFQIHLADDSSLYADAVIIACGGKVPADLIPSACTYIPPQPVLGPIKVNAKQVRSLDKLRAFASAHLVNRPETPVCTGEIQFRYDTASGIMMFDLSRYVHPGDRIEVNFLSEIADVQDPDQYNAVVEMLRARVHTFPQRSATDALAGMVLAPIARAACRVARVSPDEPLTQDGVQALAHALMAYPLTVKGVDVSRAQVSRGGFDVAGIDAPTMAFRDTPGLFIAGEALDVDGPCGGYNLHWAWASGMLAGRNAAAYIGCENPYDQSDLWEDLFI